LIVFLDFGDLFGPGGYPRAPLAPRGRPETIFHGFWMDFGTSLGRLWGTLGLTFRHWGATGAPWKAKKSEKRHPAQQQRSRCDFDAYREGSGPVKCKKNLVKTDVFAREHSRQLFRKKSPFGLQKVSFWAPFWHPWATLGRLWPTFYALWCLQGPSRFQTDF